MEFEKKLIMDNDRNKNMTKISQLQEIINDSDNIVFFGGAGVSTESGIPDFRSEKGVFKSLEKYGHSPEYLVSHSYYMDHTEEFFNYYKENLIFKDAKPNPAHLKLAELEKAGKLKAVITQNIDGLHQKAAFTETIASFAKGNMILISS